MLKTIDEILAINLVRLREERGLTQHGLAELADLSVGTVQNAEYRKTFIRLPQISALARALKVTEGRLFLDPDLPRVETSPTVDALLDLVKAQETRIKQLEARLADERRAMPALPDSERELLRLFATLDDDESRSRALTVVRSIAGAGAELSNYLTENKKSVHNKK